MRPTGQRRPIDSCPKGEVITIYSLAFYPAFLLAPVFPLPYTHFIKKFLSKSLGGPAEKERGEENG
jgi:hypothetical protein